jgi:hypothetical protein
MANPYTTLTTAVDNYLSNIEQELQAGQPPSPRRLETITEELKKSFGGYLDLALDANLVNIETCVALINSISKIGSQLAETHEPHDVPRELKHSLDLLAELAARSCRFTLVPRVRAFIEVYKDCLRKSLDRVEFYGD